MGDVGGPGKFLGQMAREGRVYAGTHVGTDNYGNKYYENNTDMVYVSYCLPPSSLAAWGAGPGRCPLSAALIKLACPCFRFLPGTDRTVGSITRSATTS